MVSFGHARACRSVVSANYWYVVTVLIDVMDIQFYTDTTDMTHCCGRSAPASLLEPFVPHVQCLVLMLALQLIAEQLAVAGEASEVLAKLQAVVRMSQTRPPTTIAARFW